ncbi:unnamed protein product [Ceratitis capitata]|uniref:(Mediterranean fruit fly) hypothetical protein n=1 Tax=Ceratitis capitata TaxID=7213 RepID=A0A811U8K4_CERCA|nr:unnamed protein product [Ceratitis capitata]
MSQLNVEHMDERRRATSSKAARNEQRATIVRTVTNDVRRINLTFNETISISITIGVQCAVWQKRHPSHAISITVVVVVIVIKTSRSELCLAETPLQPAGTISFAPTTKAKQLKRGSQLMP